jgi:hypothetical protein
MQGNNEPATPATGGGAPPVPKVCADGVYEPKNQHITPDLPFVFIGHVGHA